MKLIEADKVEQAIKDYWKAYVDRMPTPYSTEEFEKFANRTAVCFEHRDGLLKAIDELPSAEPYTTTHDSIPVETGKNGGDGTSGDCISRTQAIDAFYQYPNINWTILDVMEKINELPSVQPDLGKYEYHYDHTDCIWYRPEARNRCPVTCAQYRDGWNDAMNYIFRGGKGYRPYRRGEQYEE